MPRKKRERQKVTPRKVSSSARNASKSVNVSISQAGRANNHRSVPASQLSARSFAARDRALHALGDMRRGVSPSQAARGNGVTVRTIKKYVGAALVQDRPGGRLRAAKTDRLVRFVQIPGAFGPVEIKVRGLKQATDAAKYDAAVSRFLSGDLKALAPWHGKKIGGVELITAGPALKGLAQKELLPHSLYRALAGGAA